MFGCGSPDLYCPSGSIAPVPVLTGRYTTDWTEICGPGYYRNFTLSVDETVPGPSVITTDVLNPVCEPCPANTFKSVNYSRSEPGQGTCVCYDVTGGDSTKLQHQLLHTQSQQQQDQVQMLSDYVLYYNVSSRDCVAVTFSVFEDISQDFLRTNWSVTKYQQTDCEPGNYCLNGIRHPCSPGTYGTSWRESRPACEGLCPEGYYCPAGSNRERMRDCGGTHLYCPMGSPAPLVVPSGYYSDPSDNTPPDNRYRILLCPPGYWCGGDGVKYPCVAGVYGGRYGLTSKDCDGPCHAGYYCVEASTTPTHTVCGNSSVYCPRGSPVPRRVHSGFYGVYTGDNAGSLGYWDKDNMTYSAELPCEPGYYCIDGIKYPCFFNWRYGMNISTCVGQCAKGHYCPSYLVPQPDAPTSTIWPRKPHTRADDFECGNVDLYCPQGSPYPLQVTGGYYSIGGGVDNRTRWDQVICPLGSYCVGGIARHCARGRYGNESGLSNYVCSGSFTALYLSAFVHWVTTVRRTRHTPSLVPIDTTRLGASGTRLSRKALHIWAADA
eukprot:gene5102-10210_t